MTKAPLTHKKVSMYGVHGEFVWLRVCALLELYDFFDRCCSRELSELEERWESLSRKQTLGSGAGNGLVAERESLESISSDFGYSMVTLLYSVVDHALRSVLGRLKWNDRSLAGVYTRDYKKPKGKNLRGSTFLEKYAHFHAANLGSDFWSGVAPPRTRLGPFPDSLSSGASDIDIDLLVDFTWARGKIVHDQGSVKADEMARRGGAPRDVPLDGAFDSDDDGFRRSVRIDVQRDWFERVAQHLVAFFDKVCEDLRVRYEQGKQT